MHMLRFRSTEPCTKTRGACDDRSSKTTLNLSRHYVKLFCNPLRSFALIVSAHPYCARNPLRDVMPRHALSARAVEEMWRYIALVGTLISMHGFNSLKCSVTLYFLLIDHFLCRLSTFCEKLKKICFVEV